MGPSVHGSTSEGREASSGGVGSEGAGAALFSEGVFLDLAESVLETGVGEGASGESEDDEGLFHFE